MDVNGTRFQLLLGRDDWRYCLDWQMRPLGQGWKPRESGGLAGKETGLDWDEKRSELTLHQRLAQFRAAPSDAAPTLKARRGAARDRYGNWYWISVSRVEILTSSSGRGRAAHFWSCGDAQKCEPEWPAAGGGFLPCGAEPPAAPAELSGLAVTDDHYLVVGTLRPAGLLVFDLHAGGAPRRMF
ncbi:MAG TPA: hypothetical protein VD968_15345 [Pyrinomonadaceae bacterium]|nr:hypothetical protein [Pyrinomonadaceae bacterium]